MGLAGGAPREIWDASPPPVPPPLYGAQDFHQQWTWPAYLRPDYNRPWTRATVSLRDLLRTMIELVRDMQPHYHGDSRGVPDPTNSM